MLAAYKYHFWLHFIVLLYGFTGILGKLITLDATVLVWYRVLIGFLSTGLFMIWRKEKRTTNNKGLLKMMITGVVTAFHWVCFFESIKRSNVSVALICLSSTTFFTSLIEPLIHKRSVRLYEVIFGLIVILGLGFIFNVEITYREGIFFGLLAALLAAIFSVINSVLIREYSSTQITLWELIGGFAGLSIYLTLTGASMEAFQLSANDLFYLLILGVVCTAFAFVVSVEVMKYITPFTVNISINLEPVYGIVLALLIFGESEQMSPAFYLGTIVILVVIFANAWMKKRRPTVKL